MNNDITEIEKQFFEAFNIPKKLDCKRCCAANFALGQCAEVNCERVPPPITDRILLELICILNNYGKDIWACNIDSLRCAVLNKCINIIRTKDLSAITLVKIKHQVQALFKENN